MRDLLFLGGPLHGQRHEVPMITMYGEREMGLYWKPTGPFTQEQIAKQEDRKFIPLTYQVSVVKLTDNPDVPVMVYKPILDVAPELRDEDIDELLVKFLTSGAQEMPA